MIDARRDPELAELKPTATNVRAAAQEGRVYKGFMWCMLDRHLPDDTVQKIERVRVSKQLRVGPVAELDSARSAILKVYPDRQSVATAYGYKDVSSIIKRIAAGKQTGGKFHVPYAEVEGDLRKAFEEGGGVVPSTRRSNARPIARLDPDTLEVLRVYESQDEVCRDLGVGRHTLYPAINGDLVLRGQRWRFVCPTAATASR